MAPIPASALIVMGKLSSEAFMRCKFVAQEHQQKGGVPTIHVVPMVPAEYEEYIIRELKSLTTAEHSEDVVCLLDFGGNKPRQYQGGEKAFLSWYQEKCGPASEQDVMVVRKACMESWQNYCSSTGRQYCFVSIGSSEAGALGTLVIELYSDICPKTCEKFLLYVNGDSKSWPKLQYKGTPIHRIVPKAYLQAGDVVDGSGAGQLASTFADETFAVKHDTLGVIGMANLGVPNTNGAQFYITLDSLPWLDGKKVAFGRVVDGLLLLKKLETTPTRNERPVNELVITECGMYNLQATA